MAFAPDGSLYFSALTYNLDKFPREMSGVAVSKSTDGGLHWARPVMVSYNAAGNTFYDKEWIGVSNDGTVNLTWTKFYQGPRGLSYIKSPIVISQSKNGGKSWSSIDPGLSSPLFATPFVMDVTNAKHIVLGGREIAETLRAKTVEEANNPDINTADPTLSEPWIKVFDLGTAQHPGSDTAGRLGSTGQADPTSTEIPNSMSAVDTRGDDTYVGYCGYCDIVTGGTPFHSGIATNVGASSDPKAGTSRGWHIAAAKGLPERYVNSVRIDPADPRKGVERLAAAVAAGDGPPLVLAGRAGPEAEALAAPGRVQLAGRLDDDDLAALYSAADALVFPSGDEGFGLPPLEALACGTPVAAFATGALTETLAREEGARLVPAGDYDGLLAAAAALAGTRAQPPPRTWADVARETIAVYEEAARGRAST
jgi:hypothetical protein